MRIARQPTRETRQASKSQRAAIVNAAQPSRRTPQPRWRVKMTGSRVIPCLRYRDAKRMIGWLCDAYGFRAQAVYEDGSDGIAHAQLTLGNGMIMLGSLRDDRFSQAQSTPAALGGTTQSPYLVVADADAIYYSAVAAGAEIVIEIKDEDYGGRGGCLGGCGGPRRDGGAFCAL